MIEEPDLLRNDEGDETLGFRRMCSEVAVRLSADDFAGWRVGEEPFREGNLIPPAEPLTPRGDKESHGGKRVVRPKALAEEMLAVGRLAETAVHQLHHGPARWQ